MCQRTEDRRLRTENRGLHVGLVEFTQATRFGWLRMAAPTLRNSTHYAKICKKQGGWVAEGIFVNDSEK